MPSRSISLLIAIAVAIAIGVATAIPARASGAESPVVWSFAVSGDSRDCGDLIMPKIAAAVTSETPAVDLFWHLGDLRRMYDIDCDILKREHPDFDCDALPWGQLGETAMSDYLDLAWSDAIERQLKPFGKTPVLLGMGNHELFGRARDDFKRAFQPWLAQKALHVQRLADAAKGIYTSETETSFHLVHRGVDLIYLDNADEKAFTPQQIMWLTRILALDAKDDAVRTIVVGLHATLPYSVSRGHAMDATCQGLCSGQQAYDLLYRAQNLSGPPGKQKLVYVFSSHAHLYAENVYDTPEHRGQVLPGWIVGTAGAEQYTAQISYGYLRVDVHEDGTIVSVFRPILRSSPPLAAGPGADSLADFCFTQNKGSSYDDFFKGICVCGAAR